MSCHSKNLSNPALVGDPVDVTSGANTDVSGEFFLHGAEPFKWQRYYNSLHHRWRRRLGWGHTHEYDHQLQYDIDGLRYTGPDGEPVGFDALLADGQTATNGGYRLTRVDSGRYGLWHPRQAYEVVFVFRPGALAASVSEINDGGRHLHFRYDEVGHLTWIGLPDARSVEVRADAEGRVTALLLIGLVDGASPKPLMGYQYDAGGNLVSGVDAYRNSFSFRYDRENRMTGRTDRNGYSFLFDYDDQGWCVRAGGEDAVQEVRLRYLRPECVTVVTKPDGGEWTYFYNEFRQVTQIVDPLGGVRKFEIDESGIVTGETDANGNLTKYVYSKEGEPVAKISPIGIKYGFDDPPPPRYRPHRLPANPLEYEFGDLPGQTSRRQSTSPGDTGLPPAVRKLLNKSLPGEYGRLVFDSFGNLARQSVHSGAVRRWGYDANGNLTQYADFSGATYTFKYSSWNHLTHEADPLGHVVRSEFTKSEKLASVIDGGFTRQQYGYNLVNAVSFVERHGQLLETYEYDLAGNLICKRDASGAPLIRFEILPRNLIGVRHLASGDIQRFEYNDLGYLLRTQSQSADIRFEYDKPGRVAKDLRDGRGVEHRYEEDTLAETVVFGRFTTRYQKLSDGSTVIQDCAGATHRISCLSGGVVAREFSNGAAEYTRFGHTGNVHAKVVLRRHGASRPWIRRYEWSPDGDLLSLHDTESGSYSWRYDSARRLREMSLPDGSREVFGYDAGGNLLQAPGLSGVTIGSGNRLASANGDSFEFNDRDHVATRRGPQGASHYRYDSRDMLVRVENGSGTWEAAYDGLGRRVRKTAGGRITEYFWDTDRLAAEINPSGKLRVYVYPDSFSLTPFMFIDYASVDEDPRNGTRYFIFTNQLAAPVRIDDGAGHTVWSCSYTPYGTAQIAPSSTIEYNLRFPGHYFDAETGLHYNRFRYYSPELGRYLQCDPEGITGGLNLYAYTSNPLVEVDLRGLVCAKHDRKKQGKADMTCQNCLNSDPALRDALTKTGIGMINSPEDLRLETARRGQVIKERISSNDRGPCFSMVLDQETGQAFPGLNKKTAPDPLHPILKERIDNPPEGGWRNPDKEGSHSEIYALNDALYERERRRGLKPGTLPESDTEGLLIDNERIWANQSGQMPCCPNCTHITGNIPSQAGKDPIGRIPIPRRPSDQGSSSNGGGGGSQ